MLTRVRLHIFLNAVAIVSTRALRTQKRIILFTNVNVLISIRVLGDIQRVKRTINHSFTSFSSSHINIYFIAHPIILGQALLANSADNQIEQTVIIKIFLIQILVHREETIFHEINTDEVLSV